MHMMALSDHWLKSRNSSKRCVERCSAACELDYNMVRGASSSQAFDGKIFMCDVQTATA